MKSSTYNCVECASHGKHRKATSWCGAVLFITNDERKQITAGWCQYHRNEIEKYHVKRHLHGCIMLWCEDMGWK